MTRASTHKKVNSETVQIVFPVDGPVRGVQPYYVWSTRQALHNPDGEGGITSASVTLVWTPERETSKFGNIPKGCPPKQGSS